MLLWGVILMWSIFLLLLSTRASAGYCFVELSSPAAAAKAISTLNGVLIPGTTKVFKLNWATGGGVSSS